MPSNRACTLMRPPPPSAATTSLGTSTKAPPRSASTSGASKRSTSERDDQDAEDDEHERGQHDPDVRSTQIAPPDVGFVGHVLRRAHLRQVARLLPRLARGGPHERNRRGQPGPDAVRGITKDCPPFLGDPSVDGAIARAGPCVTAVSRDLRPWGLEGARNILRADSKYSGGCHGHRPRPRRAD